MTKPIPEGYHSLTPHLIVKDAAKAIDWYAKAFGATEILRMPGPGGKGVMHAEIKIGDSHIMMAEENPAFNNKSPSTLGGSPVALHLYVEDADKAFKQAVDAGAKAEMPPQDMFWGDRYGKVTDPDGHSWSIATHTKDMSPEEIMAGAAKAFSE